MKIKFTKHNYLKIPVGTVVECTANGNFSSGSWDVNAQTVRTVTTDLDAIDDDDFEYFVDDSFAELV